MSDQLMKPTITEIKAGGFTSVRKQTMASLRDKTKPRTVEVFKRESDGTFWWVNSSHCGKDVHVLQVQEVTKSGVLTYHEIRE